MAETLQNGTVIPQPADKISGTGVQEMRTLGAAADRGIGDAKSAAASALDMAIKHYRGTLPDGADLNTYNQLVDNGLWALSGAATYANVPALGYVVIENGGFGGRQTVISSATGEVLTRLRGSTSSSGTNWRPWQGQTGFAGSEMTSGSFDDIREPGVRIVPNSSAAGNITGWPEDSAKTTTALITYAASTGIAFQELKVFGASGGAWERRTSAINTQPFPWSAWVRTDVKSGGAATSGSSAGLRHHILEEDFSRRYGGTISTGELGAVSLRCDHGLANFRDHILPLTKAAGMRPSLALNSRNWGYAENAGVTAEVVNGWVAAGDVEIWNHSATHGNATTVAELEDQIITGLAELREQLPAAQIDGWVIPGVQAPSPYMGFNNGTTAVGYPDSVAGRMILEHHAVATGHIPLTYHRILDGRIRQAQFHYGLDTRTPANAINQIDFAIANKRGLQLMIHPSVIGSAGSITAAQLEEIIDYIVQRRDAGDLVTLSPYQMMIADSRGTNRDAYAAYMAEIGA